MQRIYDSDEYDHIVSELALEFQSEVDRGQSKEIAEAAIATYMDLGETRRVITINTNAEVYGSQIATLQGEVISPIDVIRHSEQYPSHELSRGVADTMTTVAVAMLARDLNDERGYHDGW